MLLREKNRLMDPEHGDFPSRPVGITSKVEIQSGSTVRLSSGACDACHVSVFRRTALGQRLIDKELLRFYREWPESPCSVLTANHRPGMLSPLQGLVGRFPGLCMDLVWICGDPLPQIHYLTAA
jgi:hypothetical protein